MSAKVAIFVGKPTELTELEEKINEFLNKQIKRGSRKVKMKVEIEELTATSLPTGDIVIILGYELSPSPSRRSLR